MSYLDKVKSQLAKSRLLNQVIEEKIARVTQENEVIDLSTKLDTYYYENKTTCDVDEICDLRDELFEADLANDRDRYNSVRERILVLTATTQSERES